MPGGLYVLGTLPKESSKSVAVVGARACSAYGRQEAIRFSRALAARGVQIISGLAWGLDSEGHKGALEAGGVTVAVLGCGVERAYPSENKRLYHAIAETGAVISEFPPGTPPFAGNFPVRNRIISGLALGVLVVEAASRSGSLITARLALEQNRDVYAVPGPALDSHCLGCQELVRQGARPVFSAEDVLRDLAAQLQPFGISEASLPEAEKALTLPVRPGEDTNPEQAAAPSEKNRGVGSAVPPIPVEIPCVEAEALVPPDRKERLLHCLRGQGPMQADALAVALDMPIHELNALLIGLEMMGRVKRLPGARYEAPA